MVELKCLTRNTARLKEDCTRKKVSYTRILDILFPELAPSLGSSSAEHQSYICSILEEYPSARKLGNAHLTKLTNLISTQSKGRFGKDQAVKLKALAQTSIGQESPSMLVYFQKKLAEGKHYNVAIGHIVRKLVRIIYQLLKDNNPCEEQKMIFN